MAANIWVWATTHFIKAIEFTAKMDVASYYIELAALAVALVAVWFTILESRRNNSVVVKVRECGASYRAAIRENQGKPFHELRIVLQNCGLSLHAMRVQLKFYRENDGGTYVIELHPHVAEA